MPRTAAEQHDRSKKNDVFERSNHSQCHLRLSACHQSIVTQPTMLGSVIRYAYNWKCLNSSYSKGEESGDCLSAAFSNRYLHSKHTEFNQTPAHPDCIPSQAGLVWSLESTSWHANAARADWSTLSQDTGPAASDRLNLAIWISKIDNPPVLSLAKPLY